MSSKRRKVNRFSPTGKSRCGSFSEGETRTTHRVVLSDRSTTMEEGIIELVWSVNDSVRVLELEFSAGNFSAIEFLRLLSLYRSLYSGLLTVFPRTEFGGEVSTALFELGRSLSELGSKQNFFKKGEQ